MAIDGEAEIDALVRDVEEHVRDGRAIADALYRKRAGALADAIPELLDVIADEYPDPTVDPWIQDIVEAAETALHAFRELEPRSEFEDGRGDRQT